VNFAPAIDRSVTTLEAFESPATAQRNPFAGDGPLRQWTIMTGPLSHPVMTGLSVHGNGTLRSPSRASPSAPRGFAHPARLRRRAQSGPVPLAKRLRLRRFPMRLMDNPAPSRHHAPLPEPDVTRAQPIRTRLSGGLWPPEPSDATDGVNRLVRLPLRHGIRLCLLPGYGQGPPIRFKISAPGGDHHAVGYGQQPGRLLAVSV
jgi:hypothetical protein